MRWHIIIGPLLLHLATAQSYDICSADDEFSDKELQKLLTPTTFMIWTYTIGGAMYSYLR
jgi:hypothetical protein